jgi:hypothetical protein
VYNNKGERVHAGVTVRKVERHKRLIETKDDERMLKPYIYTYAQLFSWTRLLYATGEEMINSIQLYDNARSVLATTSSGGIYMQDIHIYNSLLNNKNVHDYGHAFTLLEPRNVKVW